MTIKTIYDSAGMIVRVVTLTGDPVEDALIEIIPVGGASVVGDYDSNTVYFVAGVATARPAVVVDPAYEIVADGEDSFWFEVPDDTLISTSEGSFVATAADQLVSVSSWLVGTERILVVPPLPYQKTSIQVTILADDGGAPNLPPTTPDIDILLSQSVLTNLVVLAKPKFNVLSWDISSDPEHSHYGLTRYESEADADADVDGIDIEPIAEAFYKDADEFVNGVDCWYRVWDVDVNGNRSDKSASVGEVARGVLAADTEAPDPGAPASRTLTQLNQDVDLDGTVDIALQATCAAVTGAVDYEFELSSSTSSGGTYTVIEAKTSPSRAAAFKANTTLFYKMRARTILFNGAKGTWTALTSALQPTGQVGGPAAPTGGNATPIEGGFNANWTAPTELDYLYSEIAVRDSAGTPLAADVVGTTSTKQNIIYHPWYDYDIYVYARHFNTSKLSSAWVLLDGPIRAEALVRVIDDSFGTSGGNITIPSSAGTSVLIASWRCTSNTAGITVTIGSISIGPVDFIDNAVMSYSVPEFGVGSVGISKSGGGTWANVRLIAMVTYDT